MGNKVKCLVCNKELESKHRHDFQQCDCENRTFVDGGNVYLRCGGTDLNKVGVWDAISLSYKPLTHTEEDTEKAPEIHNGYPSQAQLDYIKNFNVINNNITELLDFIRALWNYEDAFVLLGKHVLKLQLHTYGWSGNEYIIDALVENTLFWSLYWEKSVKGGHYYFTIRKLKK